MEYLSISKKTFDTVNHSILLSKLAHYGIRGVASRWFRSYLSARYQFVTIGSAKSELKLVKHGVPQGSVLGPLLFLIYVNDLNNSIKTSETYHFADDTNLLSFGDSLKSLCRKINLDLKYLNTWLQANKISLNAEKIEFLIVRRPSNSLQILPYIKICRKRNSFSLC